MKERFLNIKRKNKKREERKAGFSKQKKKSL